MKKPGLLFSLCGAAMLLSAQASACGESLYRVGKGVAYRDYSAPLPGKILMVATTASHREMAEILAASGHDVHVVGSADDIAMELAAAEHQFDLVMAMYQEHEAVHAQTSRGAARPAFLPVADADRDELDRARALNRHALSSDNRVKVFLRAIHRSLLESGRV